MNKSRSKVRRLVIMIAIVLSAMAVVIAINDSGVFYSEGGIRLLFGGVGSDSDEPPQELSLSGSDILSSSDTVSASELPQVQMPPEITSLNGTASQAALDAIAEKYDCANVSVALIDEGYVTQTYTYGYADVKKQIPMNDDTKIRVASLTKVTVGMAAMMAQEDGCIDLDDSLSERLGYRVVNPSYTKHVMTLRDVLTHTATFNDTASITGRTLQNFLQDRGSFYFSQAPGTAEGWYYSNPGTRAAGGIIEVMIGRTLDDYLSERIFDKIGADAAFFAGLLDDKTNVSHTYHCGATVSYSAEDQIARAHSTAPAENMSAYAGGLTLSAKDYARIMCVLLRDGEYAGEQLIKPETIAEMQEVNYTLKNFEQCIILRRNADMYDGRDLYWHTGSAYGVLAFASYDEENNQGVVIITNGSDRSTRNGYGVHDICSEYAEYIYGSLLKKAS